MMISRPVINGIFNLQNSGESALHTIVLDDSFSMTGSRDHVQITVRKILNQIPDKNQLIWVNTNSGLQFKGLREDIPPIESLIKSTFLGESVINSLNTLAVNSEGEFTSKELYILTDGQYSSIKELNNNSDQLKSFHIYSFIAPKINHNLALVQLNIVNEILLPNDQMEIEVSVQNSGLVNIENRLLQLIINEMIVGQQLISLKSGNTKIFTFKTVLSKSGNYLGKIELDVDDILEDNRFYFVLNIPDKHKIAIIASSPESSYYIRESLRALNRYGESLSISEFVDFNGTAAGVDDNIVYKNKMGKIHKLSKSYPGGDWHACIKHIENTHNYILRNGYMPLMMTTIMIDIHKAVQGKYHKPFQLSDWAPV